MPVSQECLETRTKESTCLEACEGTGVSTGGRAHSSLFFFLQCGPRSPTRLQVFVRMLGYVHYRQPILTVPTP